MSDIYNDEFCKNYLNSYELLSNSELNITFLSQFTYGVILNKFNTFMNQEEEYLYSSFIILIYKLLDDLRESTIEKITCILDFISKVNPYLADVLILLWCLPEENTFFSNKSYEENYCELIELYNHKLVTLVQNGNKVLEHFCLDILTKNNYATIHCIDYLWYFVPFYNLEFVYYNRNNCRFIGVEHIKSDNVTKLGLNIESLYIFGLGNVKYLDSDKSLCELVEFFINSELLGQIISTKTGNNFLTSIKKISANPENYKLSFKNIQDCQNILKNY